MHPPSSADADFGPTKRCREAGDVAMQVDRGLFGAIHVSISCRRPATGADGLHDAMSSVVASFFSCMPSFFGFVLCHSSPSAYRAWIGIIGE